MTSEYVDNGKKSFNKHYVYSPGITIDEITGFPREFLGNDRQKVAPRSEAAI